MKKFLLFLFLSFALSISTFAIDNVANKTLTVQSHARIITPITLSNTDAQALDFGIIARGTVGSSTVVVAPSNAPSPDVTGDAVVLTNSTQTAAKFTVTGETSKTYSITFPSTKNIASGENTLTISPFTCSNGVVGTIGSGDIFYIGGTLTIPNTAISANYLGNFDVTVAYN